MSNPTSLRSRVIRLAATFPAESVERRALLNVLASTERRAFVQVLPANYFATRNPYLRQVVVVRRQDHFAIPDPLFVDRQFNPEGVDPPLVLRALAKPGVIGVLTYSDRGMRSFTYQAFVRYPNGSFVALRRFPGDNDMMAAVEYLRRKGMKETRDFRKIETEVARRLQSHDWWAAMSDAPGVWAAGERDMDEIVEMMLDLDPDDARALWAKYAPPEFAFPLDQGQPKLAARPRQAVMGFGRSQRIHAWWRFVSGCRVRGCPVPVRGRPSQRASFTSRLRPMSISKPRFHRLNRMTRWPTISGPRSSQVRSPPKNDVHGRCCAYWFGWAVIHRPFAATQSPAPQSVRMSHSSGRCSCSARWNPRNPGPPMP